MTPYFFAIIVVLVIIGFAEQFIARSWSHGYFRSGIPLYKASFSVSQWTDAHNYTIKLADRFMKDDSPDLIFRALTSDEIAFRTRSQRSRDGEHDVGIMRGYIKFDAMNHRVILTGYINYFVLILFPVFMYMSVSSTVSAPGSLKRYLFTIFPVVVFVILFIVQVMKFSKIMRIMKQDLGSPLE